MLHSQRNKTSGKISTWILLNLFTRTSGISLSNGCRLPVWLVDFPSEGCKGCIGNSVIVNKLKYVQQWSGKGEVERKWEEVEDSSCNYLLITHHPFLLDYISTVEMKVENSATLLRGLWGALWTIRNKGCWLVAHYLRGCYAFREAQWAFVWSGYEALVCKQVFIRRMGWLLPLHNREDSPFISFCFETC